MCRVIELHIGKMRPFLFITCLVHSLGPPISPKRSKYDISFSYLHSLNITTHLFWFFWTFLSSTKYLCSILSFWVDTDKKSGRCSPHSKFGMRESGYSQRILLSPILKISLQFYTDLPRCTTGLSLIWVGPNSLLDKFVNKACMLV